ncbi:MAG: rod shape-determining protein MreD [Alistipes sp.]|nr:rod shape-determining protein MreD [Alistipes sp.]
MQKKLIYGGLFITLVLLQIFLVDNISLSVYFHPLIYIAFIILLPLDTQPIWMVSLSAALGLVIDMMTGMCGLNVIATTAAGFLRPTILYLTCGYSAGSDAAVPSMLRLTEKYQLWYIISVVILHSAIYFGLEALSLRYALHTFLRMIISDIVAVAFIWYLARLFLEKILNR